MLYEEIYSYDDVSDSNNTSYELGGHYHEEENNFIRGDCDARQSQGLRRASVVRLLLF